MPKSTGNAGKLWTDDQVSKLRKLARQHTPTRVIGLELGRTDEAIRSKASEEGISLKPTNKPPYGTRKR